MIFMIMNTITIVDLLNISIHNVKIKLGFLEYYELLYVVLGCIFIQEIFVGKLAQIPNKSI